MPEVTSASQPSSDMPVLEVISPGGARAIVSLTKTHFYLGRGEADNDLQLPDRRISRRCAAIVSEGGGYSIENRGHHAGVFVNGERVERHALQHVSRVINSRRLSPRALFLPEQTAWGPGNCPR